MKPKVYTSIDGNEARSPLVRVVHADEWDWLMNELRYLRGERAAVVAWLRAAPTARMWQQAPMDDAADYIDRGDHRREGEP